MLAGAPRLSPHPHSLPKGKDKVKDPRDRPLPSLSGVRTRLPPIVPRARVVRQEESREVTPLAKATKANVATGTRLLVKTLARASLAEQAKVPRTSENG